MSGPTSGPGGRRFHLLEKLGGGAFGDVFLAEQESPGGFRRRVAIKVLREALAGRALAEAARRMRDEARVLGLLAHRNIVQVLDLVRVGPDWIVVMEHVPGPDLDVVLAATESAGIRFPPRAALDIVVAVATALDAAWASGLRVVHRDIKPSNVLVTADGDVKVLDFGVARMELDEREGRTGLLVGTERYMAPERLLRTGEGPEGDVYALGATLVELLSGQPMGTTPALPDRHAEWVETTARSVDEVSAELGALVRRMLAHDPGARPTASEVVHAVEALAPVLPGVGVGRFARDFVPRVDALLGRSREPASGTLSEASTFAHEEDAPAVPSAIEAPTVARPRSWVRGGLAALVALVAALVVAGWPEPPPPPTPPPPVVAPVAAPAPVVAPVPEVAPEPVVMPRPRPKRRPPRPVPEPPPAPVVLVVEEPPAPVVRVVEVPEPEPPPPAPPPPPEPAPAVPDLSGIWVGMAGGRPLTLRISTDGPKVSAIGEITRGTSVRSVALEGTWSEGELTLIGPGGESFVANAPSGDRVSGTWTPREGGRGSKWRATRH